MISSQTVPPARFNAALVLADGSVFWGYGVGSEGLILGEICFNTAMTGYQEIITDPSYAGQIITFTFPHIGNVGVNSADNEAKKPAAAGIILKQAITNPSNFRSQKHLHSWLQENNLTGISGVDTREITRKIRMKGAQNAAVCFSKKEIDTAEVLKKVKSHPSLKGQELAEKYSCKEPYEWNEGLWKAEYLPAPVAAGKAKGGGGSPHVVVIDYGTKHNILRCLVEVGCRVTVVPAKTKSDEILAYRPDGILLSNGPGDPAATAKYALPVIKELLAADIPLFGICLGHQLLAAALGCKTEKMHQGHHGANHPVQDITSREVKITSQNHGFVVSAKNLPDNVEVSHLSLFDKTIQGISLKGKAVFAVQGHPEASPGPHDSFYLFEQFAGMMKKPEAKKLREMR